MNTSTKLDWDMYVAPELSEYMKRMQVAGYDQRYRKSTLLSAIRIHDKMIMEHEQGTVPLHRPRNWQPEERRNKKRNKRHNWAKRGGYIAPILW